jgi:hypothetical protein
LEGLTEGVEGRMLLPRRTWRALPSAMASSTSVERGEVRPASAILSMPSLAVPPSSQKETALLWTPPTSDEKWGPDGNLKGWDAALQVALKLTAYSAESAIWARDSAVIRRRTKVRISSRSRPVGWWRILTSFLF